MTIAEFKAWLEGFEAALTGAPTSEQWEAIKAKIAQLRAVDMQPLPADYRPAIWWECPPATRYDNRTVPLRAH